MIIFEDDDTDSQMHFGKTKDNLFYFEIGDKDESAYSSLVKLNKQEAQILSDALIEFIKNDK